MEIIEQIGSYAGLAAIVGLAVLSALYFSQARDVKRLREWAGRAPERAVQPAIPVPQRVVAQPQAKPAGTTPPGQVPAGPAVPVKPGTPAQTPAGPPQVPGVPAPAVAAAAGARPATAMAGAPSATAERPGGPGAATPAGQGKQGPADGDTPTPGDDAAKPGEPAPATPAAQAPQAGGPQTAAGTAPAPSEATQAPDSEKPSVPPPPPAAVPAAPRPATPAGQARPTPPAPPRFSRPDPPVRPTPQPTAIIPPGSGNGARTGGLTRTRIALLAVAGVLVLGGGAAFAVSELTGDDAEPTASKGGAADPDDTGNAGGDQGNGGRAVNPADVTVAVLNGTLVPGLAAQLGDEVERLGFELGTVGDADNQEQQRAESVVLYASGHRREAVVVSRRLKILQREAIDAEAQARAGDAGVVVVAGSDQTP
jgi:LytR cell envelope-related transcriptional attenuator